MCAYVHDANMEHDQWWTNCPVNRCVVVHLTGTIRTINALPTSVPSLSHSLSLYFSRICRMTLYCRYYGCCSCCFFPLFTIFLLNNFTRYFQRVVVVLVFRCIWPKFSRHVPVLQSFFLSLYLFSFCFMYYVIESWTMYALFMCVVLLKYMHTHIVQCALSANACDYIYKLCDHCGARVAMYSPLSVELNDSNKKKRCIITCQFYYYCSCCSFLNSILATHFFLFPNAYLNKEDTTIITSLHLKWQRQKKSYHFNCWFAVYIMQLAIP